MAKNYKNKDQIYKRFYYYYLLVIISIILLLIIFYIRVFTVLVLIVPVDT